MPGKLSCLANVKRTESGDRPGVPPDVVYASYVGDRSGSMENQSKASADGVYEWTKEMCSGVLNNGQEGYISITFFDDQVDYRMDNVNMNDVKISMAQAREWSCPRSSTKLYDTAIEAINKLRRCIKAHKARCPNLKIHGVFQLFSDGYDNCSRFNQSDLKAAIEGAKSEGISCIYLGIGQDAIETGMNYGFDPQTSLSADVGEETSQMAFRGCSLNALRSATSGQSVAMPQCLRQCSAPSQMHQAHTSPLFGPVVHNGAAARAITAANFPPPPPLNLRVPAMAFPPPPPLNLRQPAMIPPAMTPPAMTPPTLTRSTLNPNAKPFIPRN